MPAPAASSSAGSVRLSMTAVDGGFTFVNSDCDSRSVQIRTDPSRRGRTPRAGRGHDRVEFAGEQNKTEQEDERRQEHNGKDDPAPQGFTPALLFPAPR